MDDAVEEGGDDPCTDHDIERGRIPGIMDPLQALREDIEPGDCEI